MGPGAVRGRAQGAGEKQRAKVLEEREKRRQEGRPHNEKQSQREGGWKAHQEKQGERVGGGREGGREGSKYRDVFRVERPRRGSVGPPAGCVWGMCVCVPRRAPAGSVRSPPAGKRKGLGFRSPGPPRGEAQKGQRRPAGRKRRSPPAGNVRSPPAGKRKGERHRRPAGGSVRAPPAGKRKRERRRGRGRERGAEARRQKHVEPGPRDGRGQRGVEIDEEQDGPGRWRGARVVAAAGGRHAVAGISATEKTSHSQGRLCAAAAAEDKRAGQPRGGAAGSSAAGKQRGRGAARQRSRPRRGGPGRSGAGRAAPGGAWAGSGARARRGAERRGATRRSSRTGHRQ